MTRRENITETVQRHQRSGDEPDFFMGETMSEEQKAETKTPIEECASQLSSAAQALERVIGKLEAQYEALNQKIDRIIAAVEKDPEQKPEAKPGKDVSASAGEPGGRKTVAPLVSRLLAKSGVDESSAIDTGVLDKALSSLRVEQRMAVKAELARAGVIG
jgi:hypothetical protein